MRNVYLRLIASQKLLEVPKYYWKVVYNREANEAIAFVGLNNPHETKKPTLLCSPNVCSKLSWVDWSYDTLESGFMYCCRVEDLRENVAYVPDLRDKITGLWPNLMSDQ